MHEREWLVKTRCVRFTAFTGGARGAGRGEANRMKRTTQPVGECSGAVGYTYFGAMSRWLTLKPDNGIPAACQHSVSMTSARRQHVSSTCPARVQHASSTCAARVQHVSSARTAHGQRMVSTRPAHVNLAAGSPCRGTNRRSTSMDGGQATRRSAPTTCVRAQQH